MALLNGGNAAAAAPMLRALLDASPDDVTLRTNLGVALHRLGDHIGAIECFRFVVARRPDLAIVQANLASLLGGTSDLSGAIEAMEAAIALEPNRPDWLAGLGDVRTRQGDEDRAIDAFNRALAIEPNHFAALAGRAALLYKRGRLEEAETDYRRIVQLAPATAAAWNALGLIAGARGQRDRALTCFRRAVAIEPDLAPALVNLGSALLGKHKVADALDALDQAIERDPNSAAAHLNRSVALLNQGRPRDAAAAAKRAYDLDPGNPSAMSNVLAALQYDPDRDGSTRTRIAKNWGDRLAAVPHVVLPPRDRDPDRPLRIGYVSGDLRAHPVGLYLSAVLPHHDRTRFRIHCYANQQGGDAITQRLRAAADDWVEVGHLDDDALARHIASDGIDILIDMSGHTGGARLGAFARRAAPVQAAWIGYFATTGLPTMDWIIADERLVPPHEADQYSERPLYLPDTYVTFAVPDDVPPIGPVPMLANGHVTFGCCNNAAKIGPKVIALWARILSAIPTARLLLQTGAFGDAGTVDRFRRLFGAAAIEPGRIDFSGHAPRRDLLDTYNRIDIALDPFPFNGGITTVEALWMGVPVVTKKGDRYCGHHSESSLVSLGLSDLVAADEDGYVATALTLANDPARLAALRADMRDRFAGSTLGDNPRFVRDLEAALRRAWQDWCAKGEPATGKP